jgi:uncharacterized membrane protein
MKTKITLAADSHAQCSVTEHLYSDKFSARAAYILFDYGAVYGRHLLHREFTGKHKHIGPG